LFDIVNENERQSEAGALARALAALRPLLLAVRTAVEPKRKQLWTASGCIVQSLEQTRGLTNMSAKKVLQATTAIARTATKLEDDGKPIGNAHLDAKRKQQEQDVMAREKASSQAVSLIASVTTLVIESDVAGGSARAIAIGTLALMYRYNLALSPTKGNMSDKKDGSKAPAVYLADAMLRVNLTWKDMVAEQAGNDATWRDAATAFAFLHYYDCLVTNLDAKDHGEYAHLGLSLDKKTKRYSIFIDFGKFAGKGVKIGNSTPRVGETGQRPCSVKDLVDAGNRLFDKVYWPTEDKNALTPMGKIIAECREVAAGRAKLDPKALTELRILYTVAGEAIAKMEAFNAENATNVANFNAAREAKGEPEVTHVKDGPKPKAQEMKGKSKQRKAA
jgi:hypothetical protein